MTFSNFKPLGSRFAEIDVTTGMWWWKRTRTVLLNRTEANLGGIYKMFSPWYFRDKGEWCPPAVRECEREYYRGKS